MLFIQVDIFITTSEQVCFTNILFILLLQKAIEYFGIYPGCSGGWYFLKNAHKVWILLMPH
jgi:hypothetical protein